MVTRVHADSYDGSVEVVQADADEEVRCASRAPSARELTRARDAHIESSIPAHSKRDGRKCADDSPVRRLSAIRTVPTRRCSVADDLRVLGQVARVLATFVDLGAWPEPLSRESRRYAPQRLPLCHCTIAWRAQRRSDTLVCGPARRATTSSLLGRHH